MSTVVRQTTQIQQSELETERITVKISRGDIRGFHVDNTASNTFYQGEADVFLGIPYAIPPIGERKFKKSEIIGKYDETIEANKFSSICPQKAEEVLPRPNDVEVSEDCLTLNIYAPNTSDKVTKYPVMVYLYGGALTTGEAEMWMYHGIISNLVRRGVIWVSINYRVGFHGFFTTFTEEFPPNRGLHDQIVALQWIHEEIDNFGGDPKRVTVIGHSAGACSASYLALSPSVNPGLLSQIIMMSASAEICFEKVYGEFTTSLDRAEQICNINARNGWTDRKVKDMLQCVSVLNHSQISAYDIETFRWNAVIDNELFTGFPSEMQWRDLPMLSGSTSEEYALYAEQLRIKLAGIWTARASLAKVTFARNSWYTSVSEQWKLSNGKMTLSDYSNNPEAWDEQIRWWIEKIYGNQSVEAIMAEVKREYGVPRIENDSLVHMKYVIRVLSDLIYIQAVGNEAEMHVKQGSKNVWLWQVNFHTDYYSFYRIENYKPAFHGIDLFLLMQPDYAWVGEEASKRWSTQEQQVAQEIASEFTHFAKYGRPSEDWQRLDTNRMNYWRIDYYGSDKGRSLKYPDEYGGRYYNFWKNISIFFRKNNQQNDARKLKDYYEEPALIPLLAALVFCVITFFFSSNIVKIFASAERSSSSHTIPESSEDEN
ncbi:unnamed protein product [Enterobius vermicularis]|uniref:Carboxylic ester hydrolase n=1 Tax=Enterobius vermicularis TaxID=51028 RepID=A0A0N4V1N4_ENTVE|nr:unnamed protein product [Enterobius vermicularis]